jgi:hypothetical protein
MILCLEVRLYFGRLYVFGLLDFLVAGWLCPCVVPPDNTLKRPVLDGVGYDVSISQKV